MNSSQKKPNESNTNPRKSRSYSPVSDRSSSSSEEQDSKKIQDVKNRAGEDSYVKNTSEEEELNESLSALKLTETDDNLAQPKRHRNTPGCKNEKDYHEFKYHEEHYLKLERTAFDEFKELEPCKCGKNIPKFFNYLLIDPRQYDKNLATSSARWQSFMSAIFYIGKGKGDQPHQHFMEAANTLKSGGHNAGTSPKSQRIVEICQSSKKYVIILRLFLNRFEEEAFTRQALLIDSIGLKNLCQKTYRFYIGTSDKWMSTKKHELGMYLLYQAFKEFLRKGEDQELATPDDSYLNHEEVTDDNLAQPERCTYPPGYKNLKDYDKFKDNKEHYEELERTAFDDFKNLELCKCGKNIPKFFNYLLIDPRQYNKNLSTSLAQWQSFVSAIFYVGKGKGDRPHRHFQEAANTLKSGGNNVGTSSKSQRIIDIWMAKEDAIILRPFSDRYQEEVYTRQALLIDSIGVGNLCQNNRGSYHGISSEWSTGKKLELGMYLLYQAFEEFLLQDENQEPACPDASYLDNEEVNNDENVNTREEPQPATSATSEAPGSRYAEAYRKILKDKKSCEKFESKAFKRWRTPHSTLPDTAVYFNFLLIDSENSENYSHSAESWERFLSAIFYVGLSEKDAPYQYLREARAEYNQKDKTTSDENVKAEKETKKRMQRILDIWKSGNGVIVLQVFPDIGRIEALSRVAAMIKTLGIQNLSNVKSFAFWEPIPDGTNIHEYLFELGNFMLYQAFCEFLNKKSDLIFSDNVPPHRNRISLSLENSQCKRLNFKPTEKNNLPLPERNTPGYKHLEDYYKFKGNKEHYLELEQTAFDEYKELESCKCGKNIPKYFNYLLIDPRRCNKLYASLTAQWHCFLSAIFYIGKGQGDRPYQHMREAANTFQPGGNNAGTSPKSQRIVEICKSSKKYVIILKLFPNRFEEEAFTREALLIDSIGLGNLCQMNCGSYKGESTKWSTGKKLELGMYLLYEAFNEFLREGENQKLGSLDASYFNNEDHYEYDEE